ncbi:inositol monophosphatase family protein [Luteolibacter yonseiensis]|uniref:Inositol monophosphatase family protein n=1 Tax=Luteolibacter yonseiensis TaxID=1144680 RepID=A0A934R4Q6_9BACT|nr:inositol monophosphatase family protein [Luteolibacter yonseiensis]MBK1817121.1 inositol monophosphatase family protein [Luteolibacter yonseiensis]
MNILDSIYEEVLKHLPQILSLRNQRVQKDDGSFVTEGDLLVQRLVMDLIQQQEPGLVLLSEEMPLLPADWLTGRILVVDPIDGTENFTSGLPEWGVALCLYENGEHLDSLLFCPEMGLKVRHGDRSAIEYSRIAGISSSLTREDLLRLEPGYEYRIMGCCVYNMINVLRGAYATFENPKGAWIWDILGALNIARKAGLNVTVNEQPYEGRFLEPNRKYRFKISR